MSNPEDGTVSLSEDSRKSLAALIPIEMARRCRLVPLELQGNVLSIGMEDPDAWKILDTLRFRTGFEVQGVKKDSLEMDQLLDLYYPRQKTVLEGLSDELRRESQGILDGRGGLSGSHTHNLEEAFASAPVVRWVNLIMEEGIRVRASDIHFESCEESLRVRMKRDGVLYELDRLPKKLSDPVILRIKVMAGLNSAENRLPQDGRIHVRQASRDVDMRVSTLPTLQGESVVIRILDQSNTSLSLEDLGFSPEYIQTLRELARKPSGMILVTGPTGSGKTTTLYACLREIDRKRLKVVTVEDPIEYELEDMVQIPVQESIGVGFSRILRSILRHDPDIIMIGEIRDEDTAKIALQASLTGHLVISTLHTNDAPGAVTRLIEMGLEPFLIAASLKGVLAQRLVRKLCPACRSVFSASTAKLPASFGSLQDRTLYEAKGCNQCLGFGYKGRHAVGELLVVSALMRSLIAQEADIEKLREVARSEGMRTLEESAREKLFEGVTSLDEYLRFRTEIDPKSRPEKP